MTRAKPAIPSNAEIDAYLERARRFAEKATKILDAHFDVALDAIVARLSTGATITVPRIAFPRWDALAPDTLADLAVERGGFSVWSMTADVGVRIEGLISAAAGPSIVSSFGASNLGRSTSPAKAAAVRENGKKGGRPRTAVRSKPLYASPIYIEQRAQGDYVGRKADSKRASFVADTQKIAIARAREMGGTPLVERVRKTSGGAPDKWRKA